jgi:translation initiation factor 2B subunit (eIF-2B alpha/beta/delta family)
MVLKNSQFNKITKDIKSIKIQGAKNVAKAGFRAYKLVPTKISQNKLLSLRSTEPMLENLLKIADTLSYNQLLKKLKQNQEIINKEVFKLIKNNSVIFTHCHSSSVINALIYAKNNGKKFEVYNTETRPLYQGRKTSKELKKARIKVTMFVDDAARIALTKNQKTRKAHLMLIGADAITKKATFNKVGSGMFAQIAKANKIPVYIISDSLKYTSKPITIEQRNKDEVWDTEQKIKIENPAFEAVEIKYISGIISELGTLSYKQFIKKHKKLIS